MKWNVINLIKECMLFIVHSFIRTKRTSQYQNESAILRLARPLAFAPYPSLIRTLRVYTSYPSLIRDCAPLLTNKRLTRLFMSCVVVSVVRYSLRLENPWKVTGPDFIPLKVINFTSNVIDPHLYNIIMKDLGKNKYSEELKTALVRPIFKKVEFYYFILNGMSKIHRRCIYNSLSSYAKAI